MGQSVVGSHEGGLLNSNWEAGAVLLGECRAQGQGTRGICQSKT